MKDEGGRLSHPSSFLLHPSALAVVLSAVVMGASASGEEPPLDSSALEVAVGDTLTLLPPVPPGEGARWVQLSGPDLLFPKGRPKGTAKGRKVRVRPRAAGLYRIAFLWSGEAGLEESPTVEIRVPGIPFGMVQITGPARACGGEEVVLRPRLNLSYPVTPRSTAWRQIGGPGLGLSREALSGELLRFRADGPGTFRFAVKLTGDFGRTPWAVHTVVVPRNAAGGAQRRPVARISCPRTVRVGDEVVLDGSRSADPDGETLVHRWKKVSGPPGKLVPAGVDKSRGARGGDPPRGGEGGGEGGREDGGDDGRVLFAPAFTGEYAFALTVVDPAGFASGPALAALRVLPPPEIRQPDPRAADPLDRPVSCRIENAPVSELLARLADVGVAVRASRAVTRSHPFDSTRIDLWAVDLPARKVLDWLGRVLDAFYVVEGPGTVWFARGTRWLEREEQVAATYRIDAIYSEDDASDVASLFREAVRASLWAGSRFNLGSPDLKSGTVSAVLPKSAQSRLDRLVRELRREVPSGGPAVHASPADIFMGDDAAVARLVRRSVRATYADRPLREIVWDLARQARVPIGFMPLGQDGGKRVSLDLSAGTGEVALRDALDALVREAGYARWALERPGAIWLCEGLRPPASSECAWTAAVVTSYDTRMLESAHGFAGPMLVHLVKKRVLPARWDDPLLRAYVTVGYSAARKRLVVIHTPEVQRAAAAFLERLARRGEKALEK